MTDRPGDSPIIIAGPYSPPSADAYPVGATVQCERWGPVEVAGHHGPMRWPWCRPHGRGDRRSLILAGELARAIRVEAAETVALLWGIGLKQVTRLRRAVEVGYSTDGTRAAKGQRKGTYSTGAPLPPITPAQAREARSITVLELAELVRLLQQWRPLAWLAEQLGVSAKEVTRRLNALRGLRMPLQERVEQYNRKAYRLGRTSAVRWFQRVCRKPPINYKT